MEQRMPLKRYDVDEKQSGIFHRLQIQTNLQPQLLLSMALALQTSFSNFSSRFYAHNPKTRHHTTSWYTNQALLEVLFLWHLEGRMRASTWFQSNPQPACSSKNSASDCYYSQLDSILRTHKLQIVNHKLGPLGIWWQHFLYIDPLCLLSSKYLSNIIGCFYIWCLQAAVDILWVPQGLPQHNLLSQQKLHFLFHLQKIIPVFL